MPLFIPSAALCLWVTMGRCDEVACINEQNQTNFGVLCKLSIKHFDCHLDLEWSINWAFRAQGDVLCAEWIAHTPEGAHSGQVLGSFVHIVDSVDCTLRCAHAECGAVC